MSKILHVDDDPEWRRAVLRVLRHDHEVDSAGTFDDALDLLGNARDCPYSLVILDVDLVTDGDQLGEDLLDHLRAGFFTLRIIVLTGSLPTGPIISRFHDRFGVDEIIFKGRAGPLELKGTVERSLARGRNLSGHLPEKLARAQERYAAWVTFRGANVREHVERRHMGSPEERSHAEEMLERFEHERRRIETMVNTMHDDADSAAVIAALEEADTQIADLMHSPRFRRPPP